jgi:hypothetical protein
LPVPICERLMADAQPCDEIDQAPLSPANLTGLGTILTLNITDGPDFIIPDSQEISRPSAERMKDEEEGRKARDGPKARSILHPFDLPTQQIDRDGMVCLD